MAVFKAAFLADIHYFSPKLGVTGRAYELRSGSDQKCLAESGAVVDAAFEILADSDVDCVCIAGDLTNNGERWSHDEMIAKMDALNEKKPVYAITSTHDWCSDGRSRRYVGSEAIWDAETYSEADLPDLYRHFGAKDELAKFVNGRGFESRVFRLSDTLRLIAVNDDCDGEGGRSGYSPEHLAWMVEQIEKAKAEGAYVIAMEHHLMLPGLGKLINGGQMIADGDKAAAALADAGLRLIFVGHSHMMRNTEYVSPAGNKITQINLGSLTGYPAPILYLTVEDGTAHAQVEFLQGFTYDGVRYGADFFRDHTADVLYHLLNAAATDKEDLRERLGADGIKIPKYDTLYPIIRKAAQKALTVKVGTAGRLLNALTLGKGADKNDIKAVKDDKLLPHIIDDFLNVFDGSYLARSQKEEVKRITVSVGACLSTVVGRLPIGKDKKAGIQKTTDQIGAIARELMYPTSPDVMDSYIEL